MTEQASDRKRASARWSSPEMKARLVQRYADERRFMLAGIAALALASAMLVFLLITIFAQGMGSLRQTQIQLTFFLDPSVFGDLENLGPQEYRDALSSADYAAFVRSALQGEFSDVTQRSEVRSLQALVSAGARSMLRERVLDDPTLIGKTLTLWVPADDEVGIFVRSEAGAAKLAQRAEALQTAAASASDTEERLSSAQQTWLHALHARGKLRTAFNTTFFTAGDSREPELAGIRGALVGSFLTLLVTFLCSFPLGVAAAIYLEAFAKKGRLTDWIEININNLAAVPSIVFGLLGLAVFLNLMNFPRSAPLVGGFTLALMTLPTVIIAGRAAIHAVPPSIREAAIGIGASPMQVVLHHVLPVAVPGILTGTIIGMARALGETAPLLMIGMVAFIVDVPTSVFDAATALPVQVYLWADSPERAFLEKTSGAILVLLGFLILMNGAAVWLRQRFEIRW